MLKSFFFFVCDIVLTEIFIEKYLFICCMKKRKSYYICLRVLKKGIDFLNIFEPKPSNQMLKIIILIHPSLMTWNLDSSFPTIVCQTLPSFICGEFLQLSQFYIQGYSSSRQFCSANSRVVLFSVSQIPVCVDFYNKEQSTQ